MTRRFISAKGDAASVILLVAGLLTFPSMALADVPMFVVVSLLKLNAFALLALVVLIEAVALRWICPAPWGHSLRTAISAKAFCMAVGLLASQTSRPAFAIIGFHQASVSSIAA